MSKATTDLSTMTSKDRRILVQGVLQAIIVSGNVAPKHWEKYTKYAVRVALHTLKSIDPNERGNKNGN